MLKGFKKGRIMRKNQLKAALTKKGSFNAYPFSQINDKIVTSGLENIRAGQFISFVVKITFAPPEIKTNDGILLGVPSGFSLPQFKFPQKEGYVTFKTNSQAKLRITSYEKEHFVKIVVEEGVLKPGEEIEIHFGDRSFGSPGIMVSYQAGRDILIPYTRLKEEHTLAPNSPRIDISSNNFKNLRCHLTPTRRKDEAIKLILVAEDEFGNRVKDFQGKIEILNKNVGYNLPEVIIIRVDDKGKKEITFVPKDFKVFRVVIKYQKDTIISNPCVLTENLFPYKLFFGDIHIHSELSHDGAGSIDELYQYARGTAVLDFAAASDHQTGVTNLSGYAGHISSLPCFKLEMTPLLWELTCKKAKEYNKPGTFVTFPGFEFAPSGLSGHRNLYFLEDWPEMVIAPTNWQKKITDILNPYLKNHQALVIPHHPAIRFDSKIEKGGGLNYEDVSESSQPVVEIYSKHGSSEYFGSHRPLRGQALGFFAQDMLAKGNKFGFIAGSDTHQANPGSSLRYSGPFSTLQYRGGLTAIWAKEPTRQSLWETIFARRTYATTYNKTVIFFWVNNFFMGEEGISAMPRKIKAQIFSATKIVKVEIIKNNKIVYAVNEHTNLPDFEIEFEDKNISNKEKDFYYLRVTETEGERVWSSPIWVNKGG